MAHKVVRDLAGASKEDMRVQQAHAAPPQPLPSRPLPTQLAVETGYWPLFRFQPGEKEGQGKLTLDSKKVKGELADFLKLENR